MYSSYGFFDDKSFRLNLQDKSDWEIVESVKTNESYTLVIMPWIKTKCEMLLINAGKTLTLSIGSKDAHSKTNRVKAALRSN